VLHQVRGGGDIPTGLAAAVAELLPAPTAWVVMTLDGKTAHGANRYGDDGKLISTRASHGERPGRRRGRNLLVVSDGRAYTRQWRP
jgi:hypothetical protein